MPREKLVEQFKKFPGIGQKQAERFAYYIMKQNNSFIENFIQNIKDLKHSSIKCESCNRFATQNKAHNNNLCDICSNQNRNHSIVMILEKELDIDAIEKSKIYEGVYFVLGGHLPFLAKDAKEHIDIEGLVKKIINKIKDNTLEEIIFALPVNDEGDQEQEYIKKTLMQIVGIEKIKMSQLARGVSTGLEMEYVDHDTFMYAYKSRK
jgi:recombination protein RecR